MTYDEVLAQVLELLQRDQRVAYRVLKRRFGIDDEYIEDLKADLIKAKRWARDEGGEVLIRTTRHWYSATLLEGRSPVRSERSRVSGGVEEGVDDHGFAGLRLRYATLRPNGNSSTAVRKCTNLLRSDLGAGRPEGLP